MLCEVVMESMQIEDLRMGQEVRIDVKNRGVCLERYRGTVTRINGGGICLRAAINEMNEERLPIIWVSPGTDPANKLLILPANTEDVSL